MPGILAIDPARVLGWAYCLPGGPVDFGHETLARRGAEPGLIGARLDTFLRSRIRKLEPSLIVYEQPFLSSKFIDMHTAFELLGISFYIDTIAELHGIKYNSVNAIEATKSLTGRGKFPGKNYDERRAAKKAAAIEACRARGWNATADEADAIAVLLLAEAKLFPVEAMRRPAVLKQPTGPLFAQ